MNSAFYVIVNPISGGGSGARNWKKVHSSLDKGTYELVQTENRGHAETLAYEAVKSGYRKFLLVGGDGTFHETINGLMKQTFSPTKELTIGLVPSGTGNDWSRTLGIPNKIADCLKIWKANKSKLVDIGQIELGEGASMSRSYFNNVAGLGFDSYVAEKYLSKFKSVGKLSYLLAVLRGIFSYQNQEVRVQIGQEFFSSKILLLAIGLGKYYGAGMHICPNAIIDDGQFDLTVIQDVSKLEVLGLLRFLYNGKFSGREKIVERRTEIVRISAKDKVYIQADGELIGHTPCELKIVPKALRVIIPEE